MQRMMLRPYEIRLVDMEFGVEAKHSRHFTAGGAAEKRMRLNHTLRAEDMMFFKVVDRRTGKPTRGRIY